VKLSDSIIAWTPARGGYPAGFRGKCRLFPGTTCAEDTAPFAHRAGRADPRAHDARLEVRQAYALMLAFAMSERDGLDVAAVHAVMLGVDEYRAGCAPELLSEGAKS
jgi:hypothetical protein